MSSTDLLAAVVFGLGGLAMESTHGSALFTLSKPVSRLRILATKFLVNTIQLATIVFLATLVIYPAFRMAGDYYPLHKLFPYAVASFLAALAPYAFTFLMATVFADNIKAGAAGVILFFTMVFASAIKRVANYNPLSQLSGLWMIEHGRFPWMAALLAVLIAVAFFYMSWRVIEKRDFFI